MMNIREAITIINPPGRTETM